MFLFESVRRRAGYKLPRPATWLIRVLNLFGSRHVDTEIFPGVQVRLDLADDIQRCVFWQGETFEHPTPAILRSWCSENAESFFDLGSNFGFYSYYILAACPNLSVYSFEPNPALYSQQMDAQTRNHINRFFPYNFGLGDADAILDLRISPADSGQSTFGPHPNWINSENKIRVQVTRFDDWIHNAGLRIPDHPTWVAKIDVEGYEVKVLRGMSQALQARAFKGVCIEVNQFTLNFCGETSRTIYAVMKSFGYQAYDENMQIAEPQTDEFRNVFFVPA